MEFDYGIIGSGPAGYTAALNAASTGKKVVLFEKDFVGGVCLNRGCIPTKTMLHSAEIFEEVSKSFELKDSIPFLFAIEILSSSKSQA